MLSRLTNNWSLKLTALVLAIALWSHVRGEVNPLENATFRVPLKADPPQNLALAPDLRFPEGVRVTLRGPRSALRQIKGGSPANPLVPLEDVPYLSNGQVRASLDFSLARLGRQEVPVRVETTVEDVEVIGVKPPNVEVTLERAASKTAPPR